jgi:phage protein U
VIGADGIIYGLYEDPSIADATIALSKATAEWITAVAVPKNVTGLYVLVSVETRQSKYFVNHVIDITDK